MKSLLAIFILGCGLYVSGQWASRLKPREASLINARAKDPVQVMLESETNPAVELHFDGKTYLLFPKAKYQMEGLIVSEHRSDSMWDLAHWRTGDTLNSRDICMVWGANLTSGAYRDVKFWSGDWTCYYQIPGSKNADFIAALFKTDQISNTHVIATDPEIRRKLDLLELGDEVRMSGRLVDYEMVGLGRRKTSLVRNDDGNGACEILLVEGVEILKSHNTLAHVVRSTGLWMVIVSVSAILGLMAKTIFRARA